MMGIPILAGGMSQVALFTACRSSSISARICDTGDGVHGASSGIVGGIQGNPEGISVTEAD
jgi:hypothetical protein